ncbi:hypothetical protein BZG02_14975 [Labilibaculum filiforme]|uniref:Uncharacterized protein n=1 Tax=Labilibaculum filiforme TaxID=1940526 RepID=A0A2N3HUI4_9BACT|nr:hypothetical protein [Labilibaculum filiforme]PKQ61724.1 hypothetical protein BZG02_14975 [Labilibaculum filiforme]
MSFGGSVQAMISSIKNNARPKNDRFRSHSKDCIKRPSAIRTLEYKKVTESELKQIKNKIRVKALKENRKLKLLVLLISIPILGTIYCIAQYKIDDFQENHRIAAIKIQHEIDEIKQAKENKILYFLEDGSSWLNKGHYKNAKTQFYNAYKIESDDYRINYANTKVYVLDCIENNVKCVTAERMVKGLKEKYGNKAEIVELELLLEQK